MTLMETIASKLGAATVRVVRQDNNVYEIWADFVDGDDAEHVLIASFRLTRLPGCSGIWVSSRSYVSIPFRGKGIGQLLQIYRNDEAATDGASELMCTIRADNARQRHMLSKAGWGMLYRFRNMATDHEVELWHTAVVPRPPVPTESSVLPGGIA